MPIPKLLTGTYQHGIKPLLQPRKALGLAVRGGISGVATDAAGDWAVNQLSEQPKEDWHSWGFSPAGAIGGAMMTSKGVHGGAWRKNLLAPAMAPRYPGLDRVRPQPTGNLLSRWGQNTWRDMKNLAFRPDPSATPRLVPEWDRTRQWIASAGRLTGSAIMPLVAAGSLYNGLASNARNLLETGVNSAYAAGEPLTRQEITEAHQNLGGFGSRARIAKDMAMQMFGFGHDDPFSNMVGESAKNVLRTRAPAEFANRRQTEPLIAFADKVRHLTPFGLLTRPIVSQWTDTYGYGGNIEDATNTAAIKLQGIKDKYLPEIMQNPEASANSPHLKTIMDVLPESYVDRTAKNMTTRMVQPKVEAVMSDTLGTVNKNLPQWGSTTGAVLGAGTGAAGALALATLLRRRKRNPRTGEEEPVGNRFMPWLGAAGVAGLGGYLGHRFGGDAATYMAKTQPGQQLVGSLAEKGVAAAMPDAKMMAQEYMTLGGEAFKQKYPTWAGYVPGPVVPQAAGAAGPAAPAPATPAAPAGPAAAPLSSDLQQSARNISTQVGEQVGSTTVDLLRKLRADPRNFFVKYPGVAEMLKHFGGQMQKRSGIGTMAAGAVLAPTVFGGALGAGLAKKEEDPVRAFGRGAVRGGGVGLGATAGGVAGGVGGAGLGLIAAILSGKLAPGVNPEELKNLVLGGLYTGGVVGAGTGGVLGYQSADSLLKRR